ncbi:MAG: hypothetical protein U0R52_08600 [Solirubrobacterales bacterium]
MKAARNIAIVMALAFGVAFLPNGGNVASTVLAALTIGFLAAIAWLLYILSRENRLTLASLGDARRAVLYGSLGLIALLIAGTDELFRTGGGTLAWIVLAAAALAAIWRVWLDAKTL